MWLFNFFTFANTKIYQNRSYTCEFVQKVDESKSEFNDLCDEPIESVRQDENFSEYWKWWLLFILFKYMTHFDIMYAYLKNFKYCRFLTVLFF